MADQAGYGDDVELAFAQHLVSDVNAVVALRVLGRRRFRFAGCTATGRPGEPGILAQDPAFQVNQGRTWFDA